MLSGIFTGLLIAIFIGIFAWAYSSERSDDHAEAAQLPLIESNREPRA
jgi:cbb3-type cytochrome oxidase subunit 3